MKRVVFLLPMLLLPSCGGDEPLTAKTLAEQVQCSGFNQKATEELYVDDVGGCRKNGDPMKVYTFADNEARDAYEKVALSFGLRARQRVDRGLVYFDDTTK